MGRRSNEQICKDLRKERARLYSKRNRITKKEKAGVSNDLEQTKLDIERDKIEDRLMEIKVKLFKCGKKFAKLRKQRTKLRRQQTYLLKKAQSGALSKKQLRETYQTMRKKAAAINEIEYAMQLPVGQITKGEAKLGFQAISGGTFKSDEVLWALASDFDGWLASGAFSYMMLDGELIDLDNVIYGKMKIDEAVQEAMAWQHINPSPHYFVFGDPVQGFLDIRVKTYQTDLFKTYN